MYSQILVAEDSKVTLTMEQLNNYIDKRIEENSRKIFIDTSNIIENIGTGESDYEYTATQDCAIVGTISVLNGAYVNIPIYYYLKKGDKIKFNLNKRINNS